MHNYSRKEARFIYESMTDLTDFGSQRSAAGQLFSYLICIILSILIYLIPLALLHNLP